ncbi:MAG: hypothetical protein ACR2J9_09690 [Gaiellales bacterium]
MRRCLIPLVLTLVGVLAIGTSAANAKPEVGAPREIVTSIGEQKGIRLLTNDRRNWHWLWLRRPSSKVVVAHPPERLPENDEAVNGTSGRTGVFVTGRAPGTTSAVLGYYSADESRLLKTVALQIVVK